MVGVLSAAIAWALTRQPETPAFSIREFSLNTLSADFGKGFDAPQQEIADAALHDTARGADIHVRLLFPKTAGKLPVIIFSPDDRDSQECCETLIRDWESHAYAIVQLTRVTPLYTDLPGVSSLQSVRSKRAIRKHASFAQSGNTALDVTSVIDSLAALQTRFPAIRGKLDTAHIGVAGNAAGAVAAEAIAGALLELPGRPCSNLADPRVRAVLCISPQGPGQAGLTEHSFDQLVLPYLGITGDRDAAPARFAAAAWHKAAFERSQPGDKYEVFVQGGDGISAGSERSMGSDGSSQNAQSSGSTATHIHAATLAFWDAYLKHDIAAKRYLQSDALQKTSRGALTLDRR
jgi:predicted dienelactone hydrolase